ncbi:TadE/TadG family type IV pilus assembly protein [Janthinobacterium agaricidamnosum]|uniref:TadE-like family protein n=1 Tax=Janthinobacterium agaricidamnosum NBRC 102515 = DSM 9628 TaxID=1349767 RepID=W0VA50_9BURK|nr:TadE/TadG family type IV pilus assembly protein [Janthinobacterium agaricidamnosum]CDG85699.1 tadE-like family protein [Janthinobacterium agaricidamnosum NBRC 102515 = DSM 9628]
MRRAWRSRQGGLASLELALILIFFIGLLGVTLFFGRLLLTYTAMQKAAYDAARYMATVPLLEMANPDDADRATAVAENLAIASGAAMNTVLQRRDIMVVCNYGYTSLYFRCGTGAGKPVMVRVQIFKQEQNNFLYLIVVDWLGNIATRPFFANVSLHYAN